jgi:hypothetical protein
VIARGQTASEMFLWALVAAQVSKVDDLLQNKNALEFLNIRFNRAINGALDAYCAQLRYQHTHPAVPPVLMAVDEMRDKFYPDFERWIAMLLGQKAPNLAVSKHRISAAVIGAAYSIGLSPTGLGDQQWTNIVEFIRRPQELAKTVGCTWPVSKGRWDGKKGYKVQLEAATDIIRKLTQ